MSEFTHSTQATNLADILERVLDKGIVIAGDINVQIADVELLTIKVRLLVSSVDKAKEIGINWWERDPYLSANAKDKELQDRKEYEEQLEERIRKLEELNRNSRGEE